MNPRRRLAIRAAVAACLLAVPASGFAVARDPSSRQGAERRRVRTSGLRPACARGDRRAQPRSPIPAARSTRPTSAGPQAQLLGFVRRHATAYGLDKGDLTTLRTAVQSRWRGLRQVQLEQRVDGLPVLDSGVTGTSTPDGRLVAVVGAPQPDPTAPPADPQVSADTAVAEVLDERRLRPQAAHGRPRTRSRAYDELRRRARSVAGPAARRRRDPPGLERDRLRRLPARLRRPRRCPQRRGRQPAQHRPQRLRRGLPSLPRRVGSQRRLRAGGHGGERELQRRRGPVAHRRPTRAWMATMRSSTRTSRTTSTTPAATSTPQRCLPTTAAAPAWRRLAPTTSPPHRAPGTTAAAWNYGTQPFPVAGWLRDEDVLPADRLHLEQLGRRLQLAGQPRPGGHAGVLVRQPLP